MLEAYRIVEGDKILLVGEGNFSFSKDFLAFNKDSLIASEKIEIVSTCRESDFENFTKFKQEVINSLREKGVTVICNVDATNLKCHPAITNKKYNKVIFNFPHVGGKMKINLNRKLLRDFFASANDILDDSGSIVVALCDGQGGSEADKKQRRWDDSWQVTEMAAQSDFILHRVEPFDVECFPNYVNVGFRSCDKSFHCENAVVYIFKKQQPPHILQEDHSTFKVEDLREDIIYDFLDRRLANPLSNTQSPSSFVFNSLKENLGSRFSTHKSVLKYYSYPVSYGEGNIGKTNHIDISLPDMLDIYMKLRRENVNNENIVVRVEMRNRPVIISDFSVAPVRCQAFVFGVDICSTLFHEWLSTLVQIFNEEYYPGSVKLEGNVCRNIIFISKPSSQTCQKFIVVESLILSEGIPVHVIHVDELAQILFKLDDWRSLWSGDIDMSCPEHPKFHPVSLFPRSYTFDMSLSVPLNFKEQFKDTFFLCLWLLAGDLIVKTELLSTYLPSDRDLVCYCYRITYKSHQVPLFRKRVIHIHENIITAILSRSLQRNFT